ncbi:MAG: transcriptional regulator, CarD family [Firmicutes bacterium]|nr:transcriptional regulator, CarD family [Bacillota bacterium]
MLAVGDKVVYPMYGAGVIEAIEEHEILGSRQNYYVLTMPYGAMRVMIPMEKVKNIGLREVIDQVELSKVWDVLQSAPEPIHVNWNRRFNSNLAKIKTGDIFEVAEVVRNLILQDQEKKLSTGERRLLDIARQILISELVLACGKDANSMEEQVIGLIVKNASVS